jgi:hypothetical protein
MHIIHRDEKEMSFWGRCRAACAAYAFVFRGKLQNPDKMQQPDAPSPPMRETPMMQEPRHINKCHRQKTGGNGPA